MFSISVTLADYDIKVLTTTIENWGKPVDATRAYPAFAH